MYQLQDAAVKEINYLRNIILAIARPVIDSTDEGLDINMLADDINHQRGMEHMMPIKALSDLAAEIVISDSARSKRRNRSECPTYAPEGTDWYPQNDYQWSIWNARHRENSKAANSDSYRRGRSIASGRKKHCQHCGCGPNPKIPDALGRVRSGLNVHHIKPISSGGSVNDGLVTLCDTCHRLVHTVSDTLNWREVDAEITDKLKLVATYP